MLVTDDVLQGSVTIPSLKPDLNKANPKLGVGVMAFSCDNRYMFTRNGKNTTLNYYTVNNNKLNYCNICYVSLKKINFPGTACPALKSKCICSIYIEKWSSQKRSVQISSRLIC